MTKAELEKDRDEWKTQAESLQEELDLLNDAYSELESRNYELSNNINVGIKDIDNFIWRAKLDGIYNERFQEFIDEYMRWYNERSD